jgi:hypothetical protein
MRSVRMSLIVVLAGTMMLLFTSSVALADAKNRPLHVTKACAMPLPFVSDAPGGFCTFNADSNLAQIVVGAHIFYDQAPYNRVSGSPATGLLDSNVVLDAGNGNMALGRCTLDFAIVLTGGQGLCTFSDGTGEFTGFEARVNVSLDSCAGSDPQICQFSWDGTYGFRPKPHR